MMRTVASHVERLYQSCTNMFNSFVSSPNILPPSDPGTVKQDDWLASTVDSSTCASTCMPESPSTTMKIPGGKIQEYMMKEVKLKLEGGHSVADIEGHLNNTASLVGGDQIPTWSGVLKMMKHLGYANPRHFKICMINRSF